MKYLDAAYRAFLTALWFLLLVCNGIGAVFVATKVLHLW